MILAELSGPPVVILFVFFLLGFCAGWLSRRGVEE